MTTETKALKVFRVEDRGEYVWAITDDPEKARSIAREYLRDPASTEPMEDEEIEEQPMGKPLTITDEDSEVEPSKRTQTCAEWIAECGEGFLATTCY